MRSILLLTPDLRYTGATAQLALLARHLPRDLYRLRVACLGPDGPVGAELKALGVEWHVLGWRRVVEFHPLRELRTLAGDPGLAAVHCLGRTCLRALRVVAPRLAPPLIVSGLGHSRPGLVDRLDRRLLRGAARVVVRDGSEETTAHRLEVPAERVVRIPPGVDLGPTPAPPAWTELGVPAGTRVLVCVGPLEAAKGYLDAVWAFDILKYLHDDLRLVMVGEGPDRERLERFVHAIEAAGTIHFTGPRRDLASLLAGAEVVWVPGGRRAGVGVALEAMALGRPVVAAAVGGVTEVMTDGETGLLYPPGDKAALARQTRRLLDDAGLRARLGAAAHQQTLAARAAPDVVARWAALYDSVIAPEAAR